MAENESKPEGLPPSQGGKYVGFGSSSAPAPRNNQQDDVFSVVSQGLGKLSLVAASAAQSAASVVQTGTRSSHPSDTLIEQAMNGTSVAEIFEHFGESVFRLITEALKKLSLMYNQIAVSIGGGAVIRPINWKYMHKGISIWFDVPLEALAHRFKTIVT